MKTKLQFKNVFAVLISAVICLLFTGVAQADTQTLGAVAEAMTSAMQNLAKLITAGSYVAGFGFAVGAILKFKAHKDNPTQIPVGTPIALLFIAAALIFLPTLFGVLGQTMFGTTTGVGGVTGVSTF